MSQAQQIVQSGDPTGNEPEKTEKEVRLTTLSHFCRIFQRMHLVQADENEKTFPESVLQDWKGSIHRAVENTESEG